MWSSGVLFCLLGFYSQRSTFAWWFSNGKCIKKVEKLFPRCSHGRNDELYQTDRAISDVVHLKCCLCLYCIFICFLNILFITPELVPLCILLDSVCFAEHWPDAKWKNLFICRYWKKTNKQTKSNWNSCSIWFCKEKSVYLFAVCSGLRSGTICSYF